MTDPRILVIGAGSIGRRHVRNLAAAGADVDVADADPGRAAAAAPGRAVELDEGGFGAYAGVVVASPTARHADHAAAALAAGCYVLVEKPIAATTADLGPLLAAADRVLVGYNLRFHEPVRDAIRLVHDGAVGRVRIVRAWFGSYLPDWRPGADYRTTYSARAELGGGVLLDASHELDVLVWLLGDGFDVAGSVVDRVGPLEIDVPDVAVALLRHRDGAVVEVALDLLSRRYRRGIEVVGDDATLRLDWSTQTLEVEDAGHRLPAATTWNVDASYEAEARHFVDVVAGRAVPIVDAVAGAASLRLAEAIAGASR